MVPQVNKFEQVYSDGHQLSLAEGLGGGGPCLMSRGAWARGPVQ